MKAYFHIIGCVVANEPAAKAIDDCVQWIRRHEAQVLANTDREAVFYKFDAADAELILYACRAVACFQPALLRFGFASGVKEAAAGSASQSRMGERGIVQACDLAGGAKPGEVLVSSQLGSLLKIGQVEPGDRLQPHRVKLLTGQVASAYVVGAPKRPATSKATIA